MAAIKLNYDRLPEWRAEGIARKMLRGLLDFYDDPENMRRFEEWKKEQETEE